MMQLFKFTFNMIYLFYQEILHVRTRTHYYSSFVLSLLVFANIFVLVNAFTMFFSNKMILVVQSPYFIYVGNGVVFSIFIVVSFKRKYLTVVKEIASLPNDEKKRLHTISIVYMILSLLAPLPFVL